MKASKLITDALSPLILVLIFVAPVFYGYGVNRYKFVTSDFEQPYRSEVVRGFGVVIPPIGVVAGYFDLEGESE